MKKFVLNILLFNLVVIVVCVFLFHLKTNNNVKKFTSINEKYDVINLGNSHGHDFVYNEIEGKAFNRASNTLYYDLKNYNYLKPYLNERATIIIVLSYFSFGLDENRTDKNKINSFVNDFYLYLPKNSIWEYSFKRKIDVYFNVIRSNFFDACKGSKKEADRIVSNNKISKKEQLDLFSVERAIKHKKEGVFSNPEKNIEYTIELIEDAINSGYQPILVTPPYFVSYNKYFSSQWLEVNFYNYVEELKKKTNIKYLDYSKDARFVTEPDFFQDSDHLNDNGKKYFSKVFFSEISTLGLLNQ
ncbi:hypothetical protein [Lacinutrix cladophorae]